MIQYKKLSLKAVIFATSLLLINIVSPQPLRAQPSSLSCQPRIFLVDENQTLPYQYDGLEINNGSTVKAGDRLIYSFRLKKNDLEPSRQVIKKVYLKHLHQDQEPLKIIDAKAVGGECSINSQDKSVFCGLNYSFPDEAIDPVYILVQVLPPSENIIKTSSLFLVETDQGTAECATQLWVKNKKVDKNPINWSTPYAYLKAENFFIRIGEQKFYSQEPLSLTSDPGTNERTTLEAIWKENGVEMRLFLYFQKVDDQTWEIYDIRTYNGQSPGDWIHYQPPSGKTPQATIGSSIKGDLTLVPINSNLDAEISCQQCQIGSFLTRNITPSEQGYILEPLIGLPEGKIITITNDPMVGYGVNVLLKDKQGNIIKNQQNMEYQWSVSNSEIIKIFPDTLELNGACVYGINPPCPLNHVDISGINPGQATIKVQVLDRETNLVLASTSFPVKVISSQKEPQPEKCAIKGEIIKKDQAIKCCPGLILLPPTDDRIDIFGTCLQPCANNNDCQEGESCQLTKTNQLICLPEEKNQKEEIEQIKKEVKVLTEKQSQLEKIINSILAWLKKVFRFGL